MSNGDTRVDVSSEGSLHLDLAIKLAMQYHVGHERKEPTVSHWQEKDGKLFFFWHASGGGQEFMVPHTREMLVPLILAWLAKQDYGEEPDHDGSNGRGWRLKSHFSLFPDDHRGRSYIQFMITPEWLEYHK